MAIYLTVTELKASMDIADTADDTELTAAITAVSRLIDAHCGRHFYADATSDKVRYYTAEDHTVLFIDDLVTLTTLKTNGVSDDDTFETTWTATTDYRLEPLNAGQNAADVRPHTRIRAVGPKSFPTAIRGVEVTGKFGWPAVPELVKTSCRIQSTRLFKRMTEAPFGVAQSPSFDVPGPRVMSRWLDPDVQLLLAPLVRYDMAAV